MLNEELASRGIKGVKETGCEARSNVRGSLRWGRLHLVSAVLLCVVLLITVFGSTGRLGGINSLTGCELNTLGDGVTSIIASLRFNPIATNAVVGTIFDYDQPPSAINHVRRLAVTGPRGGACQRQQCVNIPWPGFCVATPVKEPTPLVTRMRADVPTNVTRLATMSNPSVPGAADTIDGGGNYPTASRPSCVTNCGGAAVPSPRRRS